MNHVLKRIDNRTISIDEKEVLCFLVIRNESTRLPFFFSYYHQKGISKFFVVDNNSTDDTLNFLLNQKDTYIWFTESSYSASRCGVDWVEILAKKYGVNHWCLFIDADEMLYYYKCEYKTISELCVDLEINNEKAFPVILLDMYSNQAVQETYYYRNQNPLEVCKYFDRNFYHLKLENTEFNFNRNKALYAGGLRSRIFSDDEPDFFILNKVPLLKYKSNLKLQIGQHWTEYAIDEISRETGCLLHFKYFSYFPQKVQEEVKRREHDSNARDYVKYAKKLDIDKPLILYDPEYSVELINSHQLYQLGILQIRK